MQCHLATPGIVTPPGIVEFLQEGGRLVVVDPGANYVLNLGLIGDGYRQIPADDRDISGAPGPKASQLGTLAEIGSVRGGRAQRTQRRKAGFDQQRELTPEALTGQNAATRCVAASQDGYLSFQQQPLEPHGRFRRASPDLAGFGIGVGR